MFRQLNEKEKKEFRNWARENYKPYTEIYGLWHPIIQEECVKINQESENENLQT